MDPVVLALGLALAVGAFVQTSIGFGLAVVAAPFVVLTRPELMPGAVLATAGILPVIELTTTRREIAWRPLGWALLARLVVTPLGVWLVAASSANTIAVVVALLILVVVALSVTPVSVRLTTRNVLAAGAISGVSGTAASIGGPFLALVLQHEQAQRIRSTLALFFLAGSVMGVAALAIGGQFTRHQATTAGVWIPFLLVGHAIARPLRRRIPQAAMRRLVLGFCVVASVSVLVRVLVG